MFGEKNFFLYPSEFSGWSNNQIAIRQINREKKANLIMNEEGFCKDNETQE